MAKIIHFQRRFPFFMRILFILILALVLASCGFLSTNSGGKKSGKSYVIKGQRYYILDSAEGFKEKGLASWYGNPFHGRQTASGEIYDMYKVTAAHKTLPLHTWVEVKNLDNKKSMVMRVNDRGPFIKGRIIDLSHTAASFLGVLGPGVAPVVVTAITGERARQLAADERAGRLYPQLMAGISTPKPKVKNTAKASQKSKKGRYQLEVSRTADPYKAEQVISRLRSEFSPVNMSSAHRDGQTMFYIYIDELESQQKAQELQSHLTQRGYRDVRLIAR